MHQAMLLGQNSSPYADNSPDVKAVLTLSPGHLKTMVASDADRIGVGVARDNGVT